MARRLLLRHTVDTYIQTQLYFYTQIANNKVKNGCFCPKTIPVLFLDDVLCDVITEASQCLDERD